MIDDTNMFDLVRRIHWVVGYIAVGGTLMLMFLFSFAQSIFGSKTVHAQLEKLLDRTEQMNKQLKRIADNLEQRKSSKDS